MQPGENSHPVCRGRARRHVWDRVLTFAAGLVLSWKPVSAPNPLFPTKTWAYLPRCYPKGCSGLELRDYLGCGEHW